MPRLHHDSRKEKNVLFVMSNNGKNNSIGHKTDRAHSTSRKHVVQNSIAVLAAENDGIGPGIDIVLFDGVCNLCNKSVSFIIDRDRVRRFRFASLQSDIATRLMQDAKVNPEILDSIVLISGGEISIKSTAVLKIARRLSSFWPLFYVFIVIPTPIRDYLYDIIARNRYRWFGRRSECRIPDENEKELFLD